MLKFHTKVKESFVTQVVVVVVVNINFIIIVIISIIITSIIVLCYCWNFHCCTTVNNRFTSVDGIFNANASSWLKIQMMRKCCSITSARERIVDVTSAPFCEMQKSVKCHFITYWTQTIIIIVWHGPTAPLHHVGWGAFLGKIRSTRDRFKRCFSFCFILLHLLKSSVNITWTTTYMQTTPNYISLFSPQ